MHLNVLRRCLDADRIAVEIRILKLAVQPLVIGGRLLSPVGIGSVADIHAGGLVAEETAVVLGLQRTAVAAADVVFRMRVYRVGDVQITGCVFLHIGIICRMAEQIVAGEGKRAAAVGAFVGGKRQHHQRVGAVFILVLIESRHLSVILRAVQGIVGTVLVIVPVSIDAAGNAESVLQIVFHILAAHIGDRAV